jgi:hypothetical protein
MLVDAEVGVAAQPVPILSAGDDPVPSRGAGVYLYSQTIETGSP